MKNPKCLIDQVENDQKPVRPQMSMPSIAWVNKSLDLGLEGILFPSIESVSDAEMAVSFCASCEISCLNMLFEYPM